MSEPHTIPDPEIEAAYQALVGNLTAVTLLEVPGALAAYVRERKTAYVAMGVGVEEREDQALMELDRADIPSLVRGMRTLDVCVREHLADDAEIVAALFEVGT